MNEAKKLIKTSIIYLIGNVLSKLMAFILIPIYTIYIKTEIYGEFDLITSVISLCAPLVFFQIWDGLFRFIYDYKNREDKYKVVNNGLIIFAIGLVLYEFIFIVLNSFIIIPCPILVNLYGISYGAQYLFGTFSRTFKENKLYMISGVVNTLINLLSNIILIVALKRTTIDSLIISIVLGNFIQCSIISFKLKIFKNFKFKNFDIKLAIKLIKFSLPIAISTISFWLLTGYAKIFISKNFGYSSNGIFAMATKLASFIVVFVSVLQMAWHESSFEMANSGNKKKYYEKGLNTFLSILLFATSIIIFVLKFAFPYIVKGDYVNAESLMPIVLIYTSINAFSGFSSSQFLAEKDSKVPLYTTIFAAIINIFLLVILKKYDIFGSSISLLISFLINTLLRIFLLNKKYRIKISNRLLFLSFLVLTATTIIYYNCSPVINVMCSFVLIIVICIKYGKYFINILLKTLKQNGGG